MGRYTRPEEIDRVPEAPPPIPEEAGLSLDTRSVRKTLRGFA